MRRVQFGAADACCCDYLATGHLHCSSDRRESFVSDRRESFVSEASRGKSNLLNAFAKSPDAGIIDEDVAARVVDRLSACEVALLQVKANAMAGQLDRLEVLYSRAMHAFGEALESLGVEMHGVEMHGDLIIELRGVYTDLAMQARDAIEIALARASERGYAIQMARARSYLTPMNVNSNPTNMNSNPTNTNLDRQRRRQARSICAHLLEQHDAPDDVVTECKSILSLSRSLLNS